MKQITHKSILLLLVAFASLARLGAETIDLSGSDWKL